jgi:hypothetical protein
MWYPVIPITATTRVKHTHTTRARSLLKSRSFHYARVSRAGRHMGLWARPSEWRGVFQRHVKDLRPVAGERFIWGADNRWVDTTDSTRGKKNRRHHGR